MPGEQADDRCRRNGDDAGAGDTVGDRHQLRSFGQALILLVYYPEINAVISASVNFKQYYLESPDTNGPIQLENKKWSALKVRGQLLVVVLEADNRQLAENLLKTVNLVE